MATLHVFGAPSAAQSTQTLAEPGLLGVSTAPVSPVSSEFSASAVTLAENDTARDETFTVLRPGTKRPCSQGLTTEQVTWDGPDDPENPKNWSDWRKWTACILPPFRLFPAEPLPPRSHPRRPVTLTLDLPSPQTSLIISTFAFLSPLCSSITAPALTSIGEELHITPGVQVQLVLSIFLLAYALGPFVLAPCSEVWGRMPVIRLGNLIFILFTTLCGFATSQSQITAFRFLAGLGGSASVGVRGRPGRIHDCW